MTTKNKAKDKLCRGTSNLTKITQTEMQNPNEPIGYDAVNSDNQIHTSGHQKTKFKNVPIQKNEISKISNMNHQRAQTLTGRIPGTENRTKTVPKYEKPYHPVRFQESIKSMIRQEKTQRIYHQMSL